MKPAANLTYAVKVTSLKMSNLKVPDEFLESLLGLSEEEAVNRCIDNGHRVRVTRTDDRYYIITMDLRFDRVNLELDNGVITKADVG